MKKAMTVFGAMAMSLGLFAEAQWSSVHYDTALQGRVPGETDVVGYSDDGTVHYPDELHWWMEGWQLGGLEQPAVVARDESEGGVGNYLKIETDEKPLLRTFETVKIQDVTTLGKVPIPKHGVFIDTMVQLSPYDEAPELNDHKDKIGVWMKVVEADPAAGITEGVTNLMVTCGYYSFGRPSPTNYVLKADVVPEQWVRLTIRAGRADNKTFFKLYLNGEQLESVEGVKEFPSLFNGDDDDKLEVVGFSGVGSLNYVNLLNENDAPEFAKDQTYLNLTWDENVASITVDGQAVPGDGACTLPVTKFGKTITMSVTYAQGYRKAAITQAGFIDGTYHEDGDTVTFQIAEYGEPTVDITSELDRDEATLVIDGTDYGTFPSLARVFARIKELYTTEDFDWDNPPMAVITMSENAAADDFGFDGDVLPDVTLDLNGHTVECTNVDSSFYAFESYGILEIVDLSEQGGGKIIGNIYADYELDVREAAQDIVIDGAIDYASQAAGDEYDTWITIERGVLNDPMDPVDGLITLGKEGEDMEWSGPDQDGFYTLVPATPAEPVSVTFVAPVHATVVKVVQKGKEIPNEGGYLVVPGKVTVTLEADDGWIYADGANTETVTIDAAGAYTLTNAPSRVMITVTVEDAGAHSSVAVLSNETAIAFAASYVIPQGDAIVVTYTADAGYEFDEGKATVEFELDEDGDAATAPTASAKTFYVQTYTNGVECAQVTYEYGDAEIDLPDPDYDQETEEWDGKWYADDTYETEFEFDGEVAGSTQTAYARITAKQGQGWPDPVDVDPGTPADSVLPGLAGDDLADADLQKLSAWAREYGVEFDADIVIAEKDAFLLNCAPDEAEAEAAAFEITGISQNSDGTWSVTAKGENSEGRAYNGKVVIKAYTDVKCTSESEDGNFFKAVLKVDSLLR